MSLSLYFTAMRCASTLTQTHPHILARWLSFRSLFSIFIFFSFYSGFGKCAFVFALVVCVYIYICLPNGSISQTCRLLLPRIQSVRRNRTIFFSSTRFSLSPLFFRLIYLVFWKFIAEPKMATLYRTHTHTWNELNGDCHLGSSAPTWSIQFEWISFKCALTRY